VKLKLMLADANLVECATDETGNRKVDRNSMHTKAEYRLTSSSSAAPSESADSRLRKYSNHQKKKESRRLGVGCSAWLDRSLVCVEYWCDEAGNLIVPGDPIPRQENPIFARVSRVTR